MDKELLSEYKSVIEGLKHLLSSSEGKEFPYWIRVNIKRELRTIARLARKLVNGKLIGRPLKYLWECPICETQNSIDYVKHHDLQEETCSFCEQPFNIALEHIKLNA